jgi:triacylglycerol lipase
MFPLGLVEPTLVSPRASLYPNVGEIANPPHAELKVELEQVLSSASRLWVRGCLANHLSAREARKGQPWWSCWRRGTSRGISSGNVRLETHIGSQVLETEIPMQADGRFEALLTMGQQAARRGWRIADHRILFAGRTAQKCGVVLAPQPEARGMVVVVLPLDYATASQNTQRLAYSDLARLAPILRRLQQESAGPQAFYYLVGVPPAGAISHTDLAVATRTLGWPHGDFVLVPTKRASVVEEFAKTVDRLRWLFAGSLDLQVLNLEPLLAASFACQLRPKADRAAVSCLLTPYEAPTERGARNAERLALRAPRSAPVGRISNPPYTPCLPEPEKKRLTLARDEPHPSFFRMRRTGAGLVPRYPVIFCHGMLAYSTLRMQFPEDANYFSRLRGIFRERGFRVLFPRVTPTGGVAVRAHELREEILRWTEGPVNIVAHSMGGLDARYLITRLNMAARVRSLTTIATPHRGTFLADWFHVNFRQRVPLLWAMEKVGINVDGFRDCQTDACREFNASTPDDPGVRYFSFGGAVPAAHVTPFLRRLWYLLAAEEGTNDGMVSVASARWGEYLGTLPADHFAQTPDRLWVRPGGDFDTESFYIRLLENLARHGF